MERNKFRLSILVENTFGVLSRVTSLFSKRGYNIESLHLDPVEGTGSSKIMLATSVDDQVKQQIVKQLEKLHDVRKVELIS